MKHLLISLCLVLGLAVPAGATTRYVIPGAGASGCSASDTDYDPATNTCGSGSELVYTTIAGALAVEASGDTIEIRAGTYVENIIDTITSGPGPGFTNVTTVRGYNGEVPLIRPSSYGGGGGCGLYIAHGRSSIVIQDLISDATNCTSGAPIRTGVGASTTYPRYIRFERVTARNSPVASGYLVQLVDSEILNCVSTNNGSPTGNQDHGIYMATNSTGNTIRGCTITGNNTHAIQLWTGPSNNIIEKNLLYNNSREGGGGELTINGSNNTVRNNVIIPRAGLAGNYAMRFGSGTGNTFDNNSVYGGAIGITAVSGNPSVRNNMILGTGTAISGTVTQTTNRTSGTATAFWTDPANRDLTLLPGVAAIDAGTAISGRPFNGVAPDQGAFESFNCNSAATVNENFLDLTCGMNLNTPVLPASGVTGITALLSAVARTTTTASRLTGSDSVIRATFDGAACVDPGTWTSTYAPGNITDSALIGNTWNQPAFAHTAQAVTNNCGTAPPAEPGTPTIIYEMDEGTGSTLDNTGSSGAADDSTCSSTFAWGSGHSGSGITLTDITAGSCTVPYGNAVNPSTQSITVAFAVNIPAALVSSNRTYFGHAGISSNRFYISTNSGTARIGIQSSNDGTASDLSVVEGWNRFCLVANSGTDIVTLTLNGITSVSSGAVKAYTSYTFPSDLTLGSPFGAATTPGVTYDQFKLWESAEDCVEDYAAWEAASPPTTGTISQVAHQWNKLRKTAAGAVETYGSVSATMPVMVGGAVSLMIQTDCTDANCSAFSAKLYYNVDGGAFAPVPDTMNSDQVEFFTNPDVDVFQGAATCCLSGALTTNNGTTNITSAAVPINDLTQNSSVTQRYVIRTGVTTSGQTICFKLYDQNGNALSAYTPTAGACMTVVGVAGAMGF